MKIDDWSPGSAWRPWGTVADLRREVAEAHAYLDEALGEGENPRIETLVERIGKIEVEDGLTIAVLMANGRWLRAENERLRGWLRRLIDITDYDIGADQSQLIELCQLVEDDFDLEKGDND